MANQTFFYIAIGFNDRSQLVSDIARYLVTCMPQIKFSVAMENVLFEFEPFIGARVQKSEERILPDALSMGQGRSRSHIKALQSLDIHQCPAM